jgi:hypothetical protein
MMLRTNEVLGRRTIPVGVGVEASIAGLSAELEFDMALAEGKDVKNATGTIDLVDATKSTVDIADYAMPMYFMADLGYELAMGDMTITPGVNFKYSSDFWKWLWDGDLPDWKWRYDGDVSGADFVGRPMSIDVGLDVAGIAGMIDVSVSAGLGFGDAEANHGYGMFNDGSYGLIGGSDPTGGYMAGYNYTVTFDSSGVPQTVVANNTLASLIDFWYIEPTTEDAYSGTSDADTATDGINNQYFAAGTTRWISKLQLPSLLFLV